MEDTGCQQFALEGGEVHQLADKEHGVLTTEAGVPIFDDRNSLRLVSRGPKLMEDFMLREKLTHFDHERVAERAVHARGIGARGYFENYNCLSDLTCADVFSRSGERVPVFVRFSNLTGSKGSADCVRDVRGFAVKMYTKEGNWDLVGCNMPVYFVQDAMKFPDFVHALKEEPDKGFPQAQTAHDNFWDFVSLMPESTHALLWLMSDRAMPRSLRFMEGFGVHTFRMVNAAGETSFVKFHWKPCLGLQSLTWNECLKINGADPDYLERDLWECIEKGETRPEWELGIQVLDSKFIASCPFDVLDPTKLIPEEDVPIRLVGRLVLDQNVDNAFAESEQVAFSTTHIIPGIDFSNDSLLQGRNFAYLDAQVARLGPNHAQLPVNAPRCPVSHFQRDGAMSFVKPVGRANYEPNSWLEHSGPRESATSGFQTASGGGGSVGGDESLLVEYRMRARNESFADHYSQASQFYESQTPPEKKRIAGAISRELSKVQTTSIGFRILSNLKNVSQALVEDVCTGLGQKVEDVPTVQCVSVVPSRKLESCPSLSVMRSRLRLLPSFAGRTLGVLVSDGVDVTMFHAIKQTMSEIGASVEVVALTSLFTFSDDSTRYADHLLQNAPSAMFDAIVILTPTNGIFANEPVLDNLISQWINDAIVDCKFIGYTDQSEQTLLKYSRLKDSVDEGCVYIENSPPSRHSLKETLAQLKFWDRYSNTATS